MGQVLSDSYSSIRPKPILHHHELFLNLGRSIAPNETRKIVDRRLVLRHAFLGDGGLSLNRSIKIVWYVGWRSTVYFGPDSQAGMVEFG